MLHFADGYLESVFYGSRWRRLADVLDKYEECIGPDMHKFVRRTMARKKRPDIGELGILLGLLISVRAQEWFLNLEAENNRSGINGNVVPLKRKVRKSR